MGNYLAFDLGAESCRAILGNLDDSKKLQIKNITPFTERDDEYPRTFAMGCAGMYREILTGMTACAAQCGDKTKASALTAGQ